MNVQSKSSHSIDSQQTEIDALVRELTAIRQDMLTSASLLLPRLGSVHPDFLDSARNLLHYLALRRRDLRPLQMRLTALGLSSLGRAESHVLATVNALLHRLQQGSTPAALEPASVGFSRGPQLLAEHSSALLGAPPAGRQTRIMVTMPSEAALRYDLIQALLQQGMDCMRINCAHDDVDSWSRMIVHLRRAEQSLGRSCKILMDLAGPKLRTGPLEPGPVVVKIRPHRDAYGRIVREARIWLTADSVACPPPAPADAVLPVPAPWLRRLGKDSRINFTDARNASRSLRVVEICAHGCWAQASKTAYLLPGTVLQHRNGTAPSHQCEAPVGALPAMENALLLKQGDLLLLMRDQQPGQAALRDSSEQLLRPASIGCTLPEVFADARPGQPIWLDDGKIGGSIERIEPGQVQVRITQARPMGEKLRADKGINLPESDLQLATVTHKDIEDLPFIAEHADLVGLSFANSAGDVAMLQRQLASLTASPPAIMLKVETRRAFEHLPEMLLTAMRGASCGVMIARGDLAVECGFERLAEVQEEILWICEAAHVPVIWATQVLENLAREGMPSRAEITDAAMAHRAEGVMLNKGPHILSALQVLDNILTRMQAHQTKKSSMLRELRLAHCLPDKLPVTAAGSASAQLPDIPVVLLDGAVG